MEAKHQAGTRIRTVSLNQGQLCLGGPVCVGKQSCFFAFSSGYLTRFGAIACREGASFVDRRTTDRAMLGLKKSRLLTSAKLPITLEPQELLP